MHSFRYGMYFYCYVMHSYCYVYVFLLRIFRFKYSVSMCIVVCKRGLLLPPGVYPIVVNE